MNDWKKNLEAPLTAAHILEKMRSCISSAHKLEPTSIDARARCFVANLSGALHEVDPSLAAELFYVLLNTPTMPEQRCVSNQC